MVFEGFYSIARPGRFPALVGWTVNRGVTNQPPDPSIDLSWLSVAVWEMLVAVVRGFGLLGGTIGCRGVGSLA